MELTWWWLTLLLVLAALAVGALGWWSSGHRRFRRGALLVAHSRRLTRLPAYHAALSRQRVRLVGVTALLGVILLPLAIAAGRPASLDTVEPEKRNRDIVLCLDVSGSMYATDRALLNDFAEIVKSFKGERISLVLFNNQAVTAFPLTDDYQLVSEQLSGYADGFSLFGGEERFDPFSGTFNRQIRASSLVGDGLASCVYAFDHPDQERPRAIILGTDNEVHGEGVYSLEDATDLAQERDVRVYALNPNPGGTNHTQLSAATEETGGRTWALRDAGATEQVTENIEELEAERLPSVEPVHVRTDLPTVPMTIALVGLVVLYPLLWWWRR